MPVPESTAASPHAVSVSEHHLLCTVLPRFLRIVHPCVSRLTSLLSFVCVFLLLLAACRSPFS